MNRIRNIVAGFIVFYVLIILITSAWSGFRDDYDINEDDLNTDSENIFQALSNINMIQGINQLSIGIQKLGKFENTGDLLGGLALSASGTLQLIGGTVLFPIQIFGILTGFYGGTFPPIIGDVLGFLIVLAVGFILLSAKLGFEL